ncbi:GNAT family N-acetyltransferase [Kitasatospora sp. NBC_00070]|uniref:GNAT family N-acetyltransferase n=1 Tax=Kitasatospora sp. NBC_00070 TaxID=2975962 RepID=UPI00324F23A5
MDFERFDAPQATDDQWREVHAHEVQSMEYDWPELASPTLDAMVNRLRESTTTDCTNTLWLAREHGKIVASASYTVHHDDADHTVRIAFITVHVHPERRRLGIGTAFLRLLLAEARRHGKDRISVSGVRRGTSAEAWTVRLGFEPSSRTLLQRLVMADADLALWDLPTPAGYRVVSWGVAVPEEFLSRYCRYLATCWGSPHDWFAPQAVREREAQGLAEGCDRLVVAVVHEADGEIVATKAAEIKHGADIVARPGPTSLVLGHRDQGLERMLEAEVLRRLAAERPDVAEVVEKDQAFYLPEELAAYRCMTQVIADLGYRTEEYLRVEAGVEQLSTALGSSRPD